MWGPLTVWDWVKGMWWMLRHPPPQESKPAEKCPTCGRYYNKETNHGG